MLSTISAHGRALKPANFESALYAFELSTISAHGRALKLARDLYIEAQRRAFNNFGSR